MTDEKKSLKVVFAPGSFDSFDGTQEELDELVAEIHRLVESGEILEKSKKIDIDAINPEDLEVLNQALEAIQINSDQEAHKRRLN